MSFASPLLFWLGLLSLPVAALYLLKTRRRAVRVPYLELWRELLVESRSRALFQRLQRLLSLLLQLAILAALVLAVAEPSLALRSLERESIVLLVDVSASVQAREGGSHTEPRTRFDLALAEARRLVESKGHEDEMLVAAVTDRVEVLTPFTRSKLRLRDALEGLRPTAHRLDAAGAVSFAREVTADREHPVVLFLSDGSAGAVSSALTGWEAAYQVPIGAARENVGIVRFAARKNDSLGTDYVLGVVRNFGDEERSVRLVLSVNGATRKVVERTLAPGQSIDERFELVLPYGGALRLALEPMDAAEGAPEEAPARDAFARDAFALDDEAWAVVRPAHRRAVRLVAPDKARAEPFRAALAAMPELVDEESLVVTDDEYAALAPEERLADVTICAGVVPEALPTGGDLVLLDVAPPDFLGARAGETDPSPSVWDWDRGHVLNRYLEWRDLPLPPARAVEPGRAGEAVVSSFEGALVSAYELSTRRAVLVAFDMTAENFPFRLAFPMLVRNAVQWFGAEADERIEASYRPGETIRPRRPVAGRVSVSGFEAGAPFERELALVDGRFAYEAGDSPGTLLFRIGGANHPTAINLFAPEESAIAPDLLDDAARAEWKQTGGHLLNRDLWAVLAALALLLWTAEWWTFHRRWTE